MALEPPKFVDPVIVRKSTKPTHETAGILSGYVIYESIEAASKTKRPVSELLDLINKLEPNPELANSIEQAMEWRSKVKIPREDL